MKKLSLLLIALILLSACAKNETKNNSKDTTASENKTTQETDKKVNTEEEVLYSYTGQNENFEARAVVTPVTEEYLKSLADEHAGTNSDELQKIMEQNPVYKVNVYLTYTGDSLGELPDMTDVAFKVSLPDVFEASTSKLPKETLVKILTGKEAISKDKLIPESVSSNINESSVIKINAQSKTMPEFNFDIDLKAN
ncbi:hypothetical protein [Peptoniphilus indolicus]|uniref:Lipoprotein n=2 Tax=Peptoniphilus indolicus TaxID=33030 RepID=G4D4N8_9FIRM|nr:hypothetical protein [Peptoniphilus indolicus]EGY79516.1 hypothetical protein HMPREF9129_1368 [Peptoniphilus indolicus ATCC 29427]SUB74674.1 Uncharacterised protein [Peptoniphilus indolicus]